MSILSDSLHSYLLFDGFKLYDDAATFRLDAGNTRHQMWLLLHFGQLEIKSLSLSYQVNHGIRQRKSTQHPVRNLRRKFSNTFELCAYLNSKPYDIWRFQIEFNNGWRIEDLPFISWRIITNNILERNALMSHLFRVAALPNPDFETLENGKTYDIIIGENQLYFKEFIFKDFEDFDIDDPF